MADPIKQITAGFVSGFGAGIMGYAVGLVIVAMFTAFQPFYPLLAVYGLVFTIVCFVLGITEAYYAGVFFSFGVIAAGFLIGDLVTTVSGFISLIGILISLFFQTRKENVF